MSKPEVGTKTVETPPPRRRQASRRGMWVAIISAVAVAVVGATASAVITPDRIDSVFGWGPAGAGETPSPTPSEFALQSVTTADGALTLDIPAEWSSQRSRWNVTDDSGTGVLIGTELGSTLDFRSDGAWIGASSTVVEAAQVAEMSAAERSRWLDGFVELDWSIDDCVASTPEAITKLGWTLTIRSWKECASTQGQRMIEFAALPDDLSALIVGQISITKNVPDTVFQAIVKGLVVKADKLPSGAVTSDLVTP